MDLAAGRFLPAGLALLRLGFAPFFFIGALPVPLRFGANCNAGEAGAQI